MSENEKRAIIKWKKLYVILIACGIWLLTVLSAVVSSVPFVTTGPEIRLKRYELLEPESYTEWRYFDILKNRTFVSETEIRSYDNPNVYGRESVCCWFGIQDAQICTVMYVYENGEAGEIPTLYIKNGVAELTVFIAVHALVLLLPVAALVALAVIAKRQKLEWSNRTLLVGARQEKVVVDENTTLSLRRNVADKLLWGGETIIIKNADDTYKVHCVANGAQAIEAIYSEEEEAPSVEERVEEAVPPAPQPVPQPAPQPEPAHKIVEAVHKTEEPEKEDPNAFYYSIWLHVLLLVVTCGVWAFIWTIRTTRYLNLIAKSEEDKRSPVGCAFLCLLPVYPVIWAYKSGRIIDEYTQGSRNATNLRYTCLVLAILFVSAPKIMLQYNVNLLCGKESKVEEKDVRSSHVPVWCHVMLWIFTLGLWKFFWVLRTTKYVNTIAQKEEELRDPVGEAFLSLIPLYTVYWAL